MTRMKISGENIFDGRHIYLSSKEADSATFAFWDCKTIMSRYACVTFDL